MTRPTREGIPQTLRKLGIKSWGVTILDQCEMTVRSQSRDNKDRTHAENLPAQVAKPQRFACVILGIVTLSVIFDRRTDECEFAINVAVSAVRIGNPGPACWEFLWRENGRNGKRVRRTAVIGTVDQFPTEDLAPSAVNGLRMWINQDRNRQREQTICVADLVDHYVQTELSGDAGWHSHAMRAVYQQFLKRWIRPHWADMDIRDVRTVRVEHWLRSNHVSA